MGFFCGNVIELIERYKILEDSGDFVSWKEIENNPDIEVFIEKSVISDLEEKEKVIIDAVVGDTIHGPIGMLFIKNEKDVYGSGW